MRTNGRIVHGRIIAVIGRIFSWLSGGALSAIGKQLNEAYAAKLNAKNADARINAEMDIEQLEARQSVLIAEQGHWLTRWIRPAFAAPFIIYNAKIILWDKVLGWGTTDPLSPEYWNLMMVVFGAYFLTRPLEKRK